MGDKKSQSGESASTGSTVTLRVVDGDHSLPLVGRSEYTLGRVAEGQPILPDVDLSPYEAYALGVSRLHAALKLLNQRIFVVDLGSSNGTRVNGQKIVSNVDYPLNHGDTLTLGKLKLEVLTQH
jgi:pSer/pThr/pTyr-binding forkhead associated (FHA) protein